MITVKQEKGQENIDDELLGRRVLKVTEAARVLRVNHKTVRDMLKRGELPFRQFGRAIRIPTRAILSLIQQDRVVPPENGNDGET